MTTTLASPPSLPAPQHAASPAIRLRRMAYEPGPGVSAAVATIPAPRSPQPEPAGPSAAELGEAHRNITRVLRLALEVLDHRRPSTQLAGHVTASVLRYWRTAAQQRTVRSPARFARMRLCLPQPGIAEVAVACDMDGRVRAVAARFERADSAGTGWRCTALRLC